ncbi:hypothetical protein D1872_327760 [compost metagenome]
MDLAVNVGDVDYVFVDHDDPADTGPGQPLDRHGADAADAEDGHRTLLQDIQTLGADGQLCS